MFTIMITASSQFSGSLKVDMFHTSHLQTTHMYYDQTAINHSKMVPLLHKEGNKLYIIYTLIYGCYHGLESML